MLVLGEAKQACTLSLILETGTTVHAVGRLCRAVKQIGVLVACSVSTRDMYGTSVRATLGVASRGTATYREHVTSVNAVTRNA